MGATRGLPATLYNEPMDKTSSSSRRARQRLVIVLVLLLLGVGRSAWLWLHPPGVTGSEQQVGRRVQVAGMLAKYQDPGQPPYGVVTASNGVRVAIRDLGPRGRLVGRRVVAIGRLAYNDSFGRYLVAPVVCKAGGAGCDLHEMMAIF